MNTETKAKLTVRDDIAVLFVEFIGNRYRYRMQLYIGLAETTF